jgi:hypothetical protein
VGGVMAMDMLTAFEGWLAEHHETLAIPMTVVARAPGSIRLRFIGIIACIEVLVLQGEIVVIVTHEDIGWDLLAEFECDSMAALGGVADDHGDPDDRQMYPISAAMFVGHAFEPLAVWIATSLMPARSLGLGGSNESGSTWAGLLPGDPHQYSGDQHQYYSVIVPLRSLPAQGCRSH